MQQAVAAFAKETLWPVVLRQAAVRIIAFVRRSGLKIRELERGRVLCEMPLKGNVNHFGAMYAGALFTLAEFAGGPLFAATFDWRRYIPIVTDMDIHFLKVAKGPVQVELCMDEAEIQRISEELAQSDRAAFELQGELRLKDGTVVARSHAHYQIRVKR